MCPWCAEHPCVCREHALEAVRNVLGGVRSGDLDRFERGTKAHHRLWRRFTSDEWASVWDEVREERP